MVIKIRKEFKNIILILSLLVIITTVSGCISSSENVDPKEDIVYYESSAPKYYYDEYYGISGELRSKSQTQYNEVNLSIKCYSNGKLVGSYNTIVPAEDSDIIYIYYDVTVSSKPDNYTIEVLDAKKT